MHPDIVLKTRMLTAGEGRELQAAPSDHVMAGKGMVDENPVVHRVASDLFDVNIGVSEGQIEFPGGFRQPLFRKIGKGKTAHADIEQMAGMFGIESDNF